MVCVQDKVNGPKQNNNNPPNPFFGKNRSKITKKCNFKLRQKCDMPEGTFPPYFLLVKNPAKSLYSKN